MVSGGRGSCSPGTLTYGGLRPPLPGSFVPAVEKDARSELPKSTARRTSEEHPRLRQQSYPALCVIPLNRRQGVPRLTAERRERRETLHDLLMRFSHVPHSRGHLTRLV